MIQINTQFLSNKLYVIVLAASAVIFAVVIVLFFAKPVTRFTTGTEEVEEISYPINVSQDYLHDEETELDQIEEEYVINEMEDEVYTDDTTEPSL